MRECWRALEKRLPHNISQPGGRLRAADAGLAICPNSALLYGGRGLADIFIGHFEQGKADLQQAMRLSPRDPARGLWLIFPAAGEIGLGQFDAAIREGNKSLDVDNHTFWVYMHVAAAYALRGDMDDAKTVLAEARRQMGCLALSE